MCIYYSKINNTYYYEAYANIITVIMLMLEMQYNVKFNGKTTLLDGVIYILKCDGNVMEFITEIDFYIETEIAKIKPCVNTDFSQTSTVLNNVKVM